MMTESELKLKELAEKATRGPWRYSHFGYICSEFGDVAQVMKNRLAIHDNGRFIAAANPQTILKLLETIEELRLVVDALLDCERERLDTCTKASYAEIRPSKELYKKAVRLAQEAMKE